MSAPRWLYDTHAGIQGHAACLHVCLAGVARRAYFTIYGQPAKRNGWTTQATQPVLLVCQPAAARCTSASLMGGNLFVCRGGKGPGGLDSTIWSRCV